jgi:hypothetical protein
MRLVGVSAMARARRWQDIHEKKASPAASSAKPVAMKACGAKSDRPRTNAAKPPVSPCR